MAPKVRGETCRDPAKVRAWLVPEAGTEVWARKSRLDQQWQEARLWWEADGSSQAFFSTAHCTLSITLPVEEPGGPLLWSCPWGWAQLQGRAVMITCALKLVTPPESQSF